MKKLLLSTLCSLSIIFANAQAQDQGAVTLNLDYSVGAHVSYNTQTLSIGNVSLTNKDTSGVITHMFRIDGHYNLLKFLSAGIHYRGGSYVDDPGNDETVGNKIHLMGIGVRLYPVNKDRFVLYAGGNFGFGRLAINREATDFGIIIPYQYKFKSPHYGIELGFNAYFSDHIGMNFGLEYSAQKFNMTEYTLNGEKQDISNYDLLLSTKGMHVNIGLTFTLGGN